MSLPARILFCTCPSAECAEQIAALLVNEGLAACVTLLPGATSFYRWEGRLCQDAEILLMIKSTESRLAALCDRIRAVHPYQTPEILAVPVVGGLADYLKWMETCTCAIP